MAKKSASQDGFTIHEGLSGIRANPTMYLGSLGNPMVLRCVKEVVDNAYDEHIAGRNDAIEVCIDLDDDWVVVADEAGGIPTEFKKLKDGSKISILTAAFSRTHAGGKFNDKAYATSAGTHGVGISAVNAVSSELVVYSNYRGKTVTQKYHCGEPETKNPEPAKVDKVTAGYLRGKPSKYGTIVRFKIDQSVVSESARRGKALPKKYVKAVADKQLLGEMLRNVAYLNPGLRVRYSYIRKGKTKSFEFLNSKGLPWIPKVMCENREFQPMGKPLVFRDKNITCAVVWADHADTDHFLTFVNTSPTVDGGWHVTGFMTALAQAIQPFIKGGKKKKGNTFSNSDLLVGLTGMFEWRMHGAQYTSQVKDKLASRVDREVHAIMLPQFEAYFKKNKAVARSLIKRAQVLSKSRTELAAVVKSLATVKKTNNGNVLPPSLAASPKCKPEERELYIVEGDSAAGSGKNARDSYNQEVLGARGKPINALRATLAKLLANKEIQTILRALGADVRTLNPKVERPQIDVSKLRVQNIILLVDSDPDGGHIATLFLAAIYRLMPDLLKQKRVWAVQAPLFASLQKGVVYGGMTLEECLKAAPKGTTPKDVVRIKGWGEVNEKWLGPIAFDPEYRKLICINPFENAEQEKYFRGVVGEDAQLRRQLLGLE